MTGKLKVYISGPYTKGDVVENVRKAIDAAEIISRLGHIPFVPHLTHFWHMIHLHDYKFWLDYDIEWLMMCDCMIRLPGESKGADIEEEAAEKYGIPIYCGIDSFTGLVNCSL